MIVHQTIEPGVLSIPDYNHPMMRDLECWLVLNEGYGLTAHDVSGHGRHGVIVDPFESGSRASWPIVDTGHARFFEGHVSVGHYIDLDYPELYTLPSSGPFSLSVSYMSYDIGSSYCMVGFNGSDDLMIYPNSSNGQSGGVRLFWRDVGGSHREGGSNQNFIQHTLALTSNGVNRHRVYIDGKFSFGFSHSAGGAGPFSGLWLGGWEGSGSQNWRGRIHDFRLWSMELTDDNVIDIEHDPYAPFKKDEELQTQWFVNTQLSNNATPFLTPSGPVASTMDGEIIERLDVTVSGQDGIVVTHDNVTVRMCRIHYSGGDAIQCSGSTGLVIEDIETIHTNSPVTGQNPDSNTNGIDILNCPGVQIRRVRSYDSSTGCYILNTSNPTVSFIEGYNVRGPFPRGQLIQFSQGDNPVLHDFSLVNNRHVAWTEDGVNFFRCNNSIARRGLVRGMNSPSGVGVQHEHLMGESDALLEDVDIADWGNGAAQGWIATNCTFRRVRCIDGSLDFFQGRTTPSGQSTLSGGVAFSFSLQGSGHQLLDCSYWNPAKPNQLTFNNAVIDPIELTEENFSPRRPLNLVFPWTDDVITVDNFYSSSNVSLAAHTSDSGHAWSGDEVAHFTVDATNSSVGVPAGPMRMAVVGETHPSNDQAVSALGRTNGTTSSDRFGICVRASGPATGSGSNYYSILARGDGVLSIEKRVNDTPTILQQHTIERFDESQHYAMKLRVRGDLIEYEFDAGVYAGEITDSEITAGSTGMLLQEQGTVLRFDAVDAEHLDVSLAVEQSSWVLQSSASISVPVSSSADASWSFESTASISILASLDAASSWALNGTASAGLANDLEASSDWVLSSAAEIHKAVSIEAGSIWSIDSQLAVNGDSPVSASSSWEVTSTAEIEIEKDAASSSSWVLAGSGTVSSSQETQVSAASAWSLESDGSLLAGNQVAGSSVWSLDSSGSLAKEVSLESSSAWLMDGSLIARVAVPVEVSSDWAWDSSAQLLAGNDIAANGSWTLASTADADKFLNVSSSSTWSADSSLSYQVGVLLTSNSNWFLSRSGNLDGSVQVQVSSASSWSLGSQATLLGGSPISADASWSWLSMAEAMKLTDVAGGSDLSWNGSATVSVERMAQAFSSWMMQGQLVVDGNIPLVAMGTWAVSSSAGASVRLTPFRPEELVGVEIPMKLFTHTQ
ncbi:MAG: hypothetical protein NPIRA02_29600 [Nitrospirales bacterium]|nr:MAG: hypothetical protein NPIRA02_29600 [Nitrospirales bacterium]